MDYESIKCEQANIRVVINSNEKQPTRDPKLATD